MRQALSDIRVVELALDWAGEYCGKVLADLGADVVKIAASPPDGSGTGDDDARVRLAGYLHRNTNKRLATAASAADVERWLDGADIVIESTAAGGLEGWGLSWERVHARLPALAAVSMSGFGLDGPYAGYKAPDIVAEAASGTLLMTLEGPVRLPAHLGSSFVGSMAALASLAAVTWSRATGEGRRFDCAATEALGSSPTPASLILGYEYRDRVAREPMMPGESLIPVGVFPCGDGFMAFMSTPP
jgi:crotonobetainyl-CoA:carnitine CoA-transferase CaiB-like acyl-CoA transferase